MLLSLLAKETPHLSLVGDAEISSLTLDSRTAEKGSLFFCARGVNHDRHAFAADAYLRGCRAFCVEEPLALPSDAAVLLVPSARLAMADIAAAFYGHPERELTLVAVTGTKGKTTTAFFLHELLLAGGISAGCIGTMGATFLGKRLASPRTTPESHDLYRLLSEMREGGATHVIVEASSQGVAAGRVRGLSFPVAILTGLGYDHVGKGEHATLTDYLAAKRELFLYHGVESVVYPDADPLAHTLLSAVSARKTAVSDTSGARLYARQGETVRNETGVFQEYTVARDGAVYPVKSPLAGSFNVRNALLAVAAYDLLARRAGKPLLPLRKIGEVLEKTRVPGRFTAIPTPDGRLFVITYAHNTQSMEETLSLLREVTKKRLIVLFGAVGERSLARRRSMGRTVAAFADLAIIAADDAGKESPHAIAEEIRSVMRNVETVSFTRRRDGVRFAVENSCPGDVILLAGKGGETVEMTAQGEENYSEEHELRCLLSKQKKERAKTRKAEEKREISQLKVEKNAQPTVEKQRKKHKKTAKNTPENEKKRAGNASAKTRIFY